MNHLDLQGPTVNDPNREAYAWLDKGIAEGWITPFCLAHDAGLFQHELDDDDDDLDFCRTAYRLSIEVPPSTLL